MITITADKNLFRIRHFLPDGVHLHEFDPEEGVPVTLSQSDALLIRTVTPVNAESMPEIPDNLQFIASASAGTDHVDRQFLSDNGIAFAHAPGCNARAVAEYVATVLLMWAAEKNRALDELNVGIVGVGNVGTETAALLQAIGVQSTDYDPPREDREPGFRSASLNEVLNCDVLTLHVPLEYTGNYPTYHWLDEDILQTHSFDLLFNTSRGGVVDEQALLRAMDNGQVSNVVIDVWENEPVFNDILARKAFKRTPHIAGYSVQAKLRASKMIADALIDHFGLEKPDNDNLFDEKPEKPNIWPTERDSLASVLAKVHPVNHYDTAMQKITGKKPKNKARLFNNIRTGFRLRNEFAHIHLPALLLDKFPVLEKLGFVFT